jgi:hypothetical protein
VRILTADARSAVVKRTGAAVRFAREVRADNRQPGTRPLTIACHADEEAAASFVC